MVNNTFTQKLIKLLEKYLIEKNNFQLNGNTYDLILLVPWDRFSSNGKFSLLLSAKILDKYNEKDLIREMFGIFLNNISSEEYSLISRISIIHSNDSFVKNLKSVFAFREQVVEINQFLIGGVEIDFAILLKSLVLDRLKKGSIYQISLKNKNNIIERINTGIIKIGEDFSTFILTRKGLDGFDVASLEFEHLIDKICIDKKQLNEFVEIDYIRKIPFDNIIQIY